MVKMYHKKRDIIMDWAPYPEVDDNVWTVKEIKGVKGQK